MKSPNDPQRLQPPPVASARHRLPFATRQDPTATLLAVKQPNAAGLKAPSNRENEDSPFTIGFRATLFSKPKDPQGTVDVSSIYIYIYVYVYIYIYSILYSI